jgi:hypothetical protein
MLQKVPGDTVRTTAKITNIGNYALPLEIHVVHRQKITNYLLIISIDATINPAATLNIDTGPFLLIPADQSGIYKTEVEIFEKGTTNRIGYAYLDNSFEIKIVLGYLIENIVVV